LIPNKIKESEIAPNYQALSSDSLSINKREEEGVNMQRRISSINQEFSSSGFLDSSSSDTPHQELSSSDISHVTPIPAKISKFGIEKGKFSLPSVKPIEIIKKENDKSSEKENDTKSIENIQKINISTPTSDCWTTAYMNQVLLYPPRPSLNGVNSYETLERAKNFCELMKEKCVGVSYTQTIKLGSSDFSYLPMMYNKLIPSVNATSWIKYKCYGNESESQKATLPTSSIPGLYNTSVPKGFFPLHFQCKQLGININQSEGITKIALWGERNSGTNYLRVLLHENFKIQLTNGEPWKHGFLHKSNLMGSEHTLHILIVKDAFAWLRSMHRSPWHNPAMKLLPFEAFLLYPWAPLTPPDSKPTDFVCFSDKADNIMQLRAQKLLSWQKVEPCLPYTYVIRYEDLNNNPVEILNELASKFNLPLNNKQISAKVCVMEAARCVDVDSEKKKQYYAERKYLTNYTIDTLKLVEHNLELDLETSIGYNYSYIKDVIKARSTNA